ncbi:MAG: WGR domain-containing protein [Oryzihumus sp.]
MSLTGTILCYLEYREMAENADKFWSVVEVNGATYLRYGRIGTAGQTRMARPGWHSKMHEKLSEGYQAKPDAAGTEFTYEDGYGSQQWQDAVDRAIGALSGGTVVVNPLEAFQAEVVTALQNARSKPEQAFETYGTLKAQMTEIKQSTVTCENYLDTLREVLVHANAAVAR